MTQTVFVAFLLGHVTNSMVFMMFFSKRHGINAWQGSDISIITAGLLVPVAIPVSDLFLVPAF